jgi:hypothetical protein
MFWKVSENGTGAVSLNVTVLNRTLKGTTSVAVCKTAAGGTTGEG